MEKLSYLDKEYLSAFLKSDRKQMLRLRKAGAKVKIPHGYVYYYRSPHSMPGEDKKGDAEEIAICKLQMRSERAQSRKEKVQDMLAGREHKRKQIIT